VTTRQLSIDPVGQTGTQSMQKLQMLKSTTTLSSLWVIASIGQFISQV
jgi:hypothetical protein